MDLKKYYRRKKRNAVVKKIAFLFLALVLIASIAWGFVKIFKIERVAKINKEESPPWLIFCLDSCFYIDINGILGGEAPSFSENPLPELVFLSERIFQASEQILPPAKLAFLKTFLAQAKNIGAVNKIEILEKEEMKIYFKEGWFLFTSFNLPAEKIARDLELLLEQKIKNNSLEYVDMRFPDKAFYNLR